MRFFGGRILEVVPDYREKIAHFSALFSLTVLSTVTLRHKLRVMKDLKTFEFYALVIGGSILAANAGFINVVTLSKSN